MRGARHCRVDQTHSPRRSTGFTLIELVISAALMSLILVSAYMCLSSGIASRTLIESRSEAVQNARVAMGLMTADLRAACLLSVDYQFMGMDRVLGSVEADNLDFATHNYTPRRARDGDFCEVSYFLEQEKDSDQFSLWRRRDPNPDDEPLSGGNREEIARSVRGLRFEYFDGLDWYDEWGEVKGRAKAENSLIEKPNVSGLPEAVRITLWINSKPQSFKKVLPENETIEPSMVFQTVARLNLAAIAPRTALNANATNRTDNATSGSAAPARPNGGGPQ